MTGSRRRSIKVIVLLSVGSTEPSRPYQKLLHLSEKGLVKFICLIFAPKQKFIASKIIEIGWQISIEWICSCINNYSCQMNENPCSIYGIHLLFEQWGLTWHYLKWTSSCLHDILRKALQPRLIISALLFLLKHCSKPLRCGGVMTVESLQPTPFCL